MVYSANSRFLVRFRTTLLYIGSSLVCSCATVLLIKLGAQYGADNTFSEIDRYISILVFIIYSSLIAPILLNWALSNLTTRSIWKFFAPALSLSITLLLINAFPLGYALAFLALSWLTSLSFFLHRNTKIAKFGLLCNRFLVTGMILTIISIPYHWWVRDGFPGQFSSMQSRHKWATHTFKWSYSQAIRVVNSCSTVVRSLGEIKQIAPTEGRNYSLTGWATDGTQYGFTLEVEGNIETGTVEVSKGFSSTAEISPPTMVIRKNIFDSEVIPLSSCKLDGNNDR